MTLYNENDPKAAAWLRELAKEGHITDGRIDERSIADLTAEDFKGVTRAHFFAGIGGWDHALRLAGFPADAPVWTGSCPCQPFSSAGKKRGHQDARHLWPEWFRLIRECRPQLVLGEQVADGLGLEWIDAVSSDLEAEGYVVGAVGLPAAGVGAPHARIRMYFCAYAEGGARGVPVRERRPHEAGAEPGGGGEAGGGGDTEGEGWARVESERATGVRERPRTRGAGEPCERGDTHGAGRGQAGLHAGRDGEAAERWPSDRARDAGTTRGFWSGCDWWYGRDGKWRPTEPGVFPLADGVPGRVGLLRGYGNAIVPQVAAAFVRAVMATYPSTEVTERASGPTSRRGRL